jgi:hypothetical protein
VLEKLPIPATARDMAALEERVRALEAKVGEAQGELLSK